MSSFEQLMEDHYIVPNLMDAKKYSIFGGYDFEGFSHTPGLEIGTTCLSFQRNKGWVKEMEAVFGSDEGREDRSEGEAGHIM